MSLLGFLPYFCPSYCDWYVYTERLEQYFEVNDVDPENRKAILLTSLDESIYKTLRAVCHPQLPKEKTYEQLMQVLSEQYIVRTSIYRERVAFYTEKQEHNETIAAWFARLKKLSINCKFGEHFDSVLLDRFISGLRSSVILDRLCEEEPSLTLAKAVEIATTKEASAGTDLHSDGEEVAVPYDQAQLRSSANKRNRCKKGQKQQAE